MKSNSIYHGNSLSLLLEIEEHTVDLIICDGPYGVTAHEWDRVKSIQEYNLNLIKIFSRLLKPGGYLYLLGKPHCIDFIDWRPYLTLKNKIVWYQPSRLSQGKLTYTNNYDLICYFVKGEAQYFDLDAIRVAQLVELTHRKRCENVPSVVNGRFQKTLFNERGKNPGDVWGDIKQLTYKSKELLDRKLHTIQKPIRLIERMVKASSKEGDLVLDPFCGTGTTPYVCKYHNRNFIGIEQDANLVKLCKERLRGLESCSKASLNEKWAQQYERQKKSQKISP